MPQFDSKGTSTGRVAAGAPGSLGSAAAHGATWTGAARLVNQVAATLAVVVLARILAPSAFGLVAMAAVFVGVASALVDFGFGTWIVHRSPLAAEDSDTAFWATLGASGIIACAFVAAAPIMSALSGAPELTSILRSLAITFPLSGLSVVPAALLTRALAYRALALRSLLGTVIGLGAATVAALAGWGVWSLVVQTIVTAAVSTLGLWLASPWRPHFRFSRPSFLCAVAFGTGVLGVSLLSPVWDQFDSFLVGVAMGASEAGEYAVGRRIVVAMVGIASGTIASVSLPVFARLRNEGPRLEAAYVRLSGMCVATASAALIPLAAAGPQLVGALFGPEWGAAGTVCRILALAQVVGAIGWVDRSVLFATGNSATELLILGTSVLSAAVAVFAGSSLGLVGVAAAMAVRQLLFVPIRLISIRWAVQIHPTEALRRSLPAWISGAGALSLGLAIAHSTASIPTWPQCVAISAATFATYVLILRLAWPAILAEMVALAPRPIGDPVGRLLGMRIRGTN